jgi:agmatinase
LLADDGLSGTGNYFEMVYADLPTFGKAPLATPDSLAAADLAVYGVPWDGTVTLRAGTRLGPRGIREQSGWFHEVWNPQETPMVGFEPLGERARERIRLVDCGDVTLYPMDRTRSAQSIRELSRRIAERAFPLMLGGDHYVMYPAYQGVCDAHQDKVIGIIQIDAHNDLIDDDPLYGSHWSGTPIRRAMSHAGLSGAAVAQLGLRGFIGEHDRRAQQEEGFTVIGMDELRGLGAQRTAERALDAVLGQCDALYLTVDIDGVDPSCAPGTGTQVPGGLLAHELLALLRHLGRCHEIVAMDLVEVAPPLDPTNQTTMLAAHGLFAFIEQRFLRTPASPEQGPPDAKVSSGTTK